MEPLNPLSTYLLVVETKSFTAAGDQLGISATAVSKQISQLEQQLGLTLLTRSTRQLTFTEAGQAIYVKGKAVQQHLAEIYAYARATQSQPCGELTIMSTTAMGEHILAPTLSKFTKLYPQINLNLQFSDQFPDFNEANSPDLAYGYPAALFPKKLINTPIVRRRINLVERMVCAAPKYLEKYGEPQTYIDLNSHCLIMHGGTSSSLLTMCEKNHIKFAKIIRSNNTMSILKLIIDGNGIGCLADFVVNEEIAAGKLKKILSIHREPKIPTYLFYRKTTYLPKKISCFIDFFGQGIGPLFDNIVPKL